MIQTHQVVRQVLAYAVRAKYLAVNPASDIELPSKPQSKEIALTHEQVRTLADEIANAEGAVRHRSDTAAARTSPEALATMVRLLAYAGLRYGECAALRVGDVDTEEAAHPGLQVDYRRARPGARRGRHQNAPAAKRADLDDRARGRVEPVN